MEDVKLFNIRKFLSTKGYVTVSSDWDDHIVNWVSWYKGKLNSFHKYTVWNGEQSVSCERKTLGMAKKVCEDLADLLLNERVNITVASESDTALQDWIDDTLKDNAFWVLGNSLIEMTAATGTGAFVEYTENGIPRIDYIHADCIFPLKWRKRGILECAFASEMNDNDGKKYYINIFKQNKSGNYTIENYFVDVNGKELPLPNGVLPLVETNSDMAPFQILTLNIANNIDTRSPMGISLFANSLDLLRGIDLVYDSYDNEFKLGKKRIFVQSQLLKPVLRQKADGSAGTELVPVFDTNDTEFYSFDFGDSGREPIHESNMDLRSQDHEVALQSRLDLLSEKCGFGKGYYKYEADGVQTATGVISQNSQLYRKIKKHEIILENVLINMTRALLQIGGKDISAEISVSFDDSIIEDTDAIAKRALLELNAGAIDKVEYIEITRKIDTDAAIEFVANMDKRSPAPKEVDFFNETTDGNEDSPPTA